MSVGQSQDKKNYNLVLPESLFDELKMQAQRRDKTMLELLKLFIKIGLLVLDSQDSKNSSLIIREGDKETLLKIL
jgi:hypothetical protein